jgi:hypothetical protein
VIELLGVQRADDRHVVGNAAQVEQPDSSWPDLP